MQDARRSRELSEQRNGVVPERFSQGLLLLATLVGPLGHDATTVTDGKNDEAVEAIRTSHQLGMICTVASW